MAPVTRSQSKKVPTPGFPDVPKESSRDPSIHKYRRVNSGESSTSTLKTRREQEDNPNAPPIYTIDLSLPPEQRYVEIAQDYKDQIHGLTSLFDEVMEGAGLPVNAIRRLAKAVLWRLYSKEQNEELKGISRVTGVPMYLVICFNVLLDLFMGCTSGGARIRDGDEVRMMHFRTLDWGMDVLRKVVIQLEYVDKYNGKVLARSVTYAGYVGVLTGVRDNLSISLNFRPYHNKDDSKISNITFYSHLVLVLLGLRPSISSILRNYIVPDTHASWLGKGRIISTTPLPSFEDICSSFPTTATTACYITICDGTRTTIFEKDRITAAVRSSTTFITVENHDIVPKENSPTHPNGPHHANGSPHQPVDTHDKLQSIAGMFDLISESTDRHECILGRWNRAAARWQKRRPEFSPEDATISSQELIKLVQRYPTTNEETHFACVMDPVKGKVIWCRVWEEPRMGRGRTRGDEVQFVTGPPSLDDEEGRKKYNAARQGTTSAERRRESVVDKLLPSCPLDFSSLY